MNKKEAVDQMVSELKEATVNSGIEWRVIVNQFKNSPSVLYGVNTLDDIFNDGGEIRCEHFTDLCMEYAYKFGDIETPKFEAAMYRCIESAVAKIIKSAI